MKPIVIAVTLALHMACTARAAQEFLTYTNRDGITITNAEVIKRMPDGILVRVPGKFVIDKVAIAEKTNEAVAGVRLGQPIVLKESIYEQMLKRVPQGLDALDRGELLNNLARECNAKTIEFATETLDMVERCKAAVRKSDERFSESLQIMRLQKQAEIQAGWDVLLKNKISGSERARQELSVTQKYQDAEKQLEVQRAAAVKRLDHDAAKRADGLNGLAAEYGEAARRLLNDATAAIAEAEKNQAVSIGASR